MAPLGRVGKVPVDGEGALETEPDQAPGASPPPVGRILLASLLAAIIAEQAVHGNVFHGAPAGVGLVIGLLMPVGLLAAAPLLGSRRPGAAGSALLGAASFFVLMLGVRAAPVLAAVNVAAAAGAISLAAWLHPDRGLRGLALSDYLRIWLAAPLWILLVQPGLFAAHDGATWWQARRSAGVRARRVLAGLALAVIPLLIFGALLASADAVFAGFLDDLFGFPLDGTLIPAALLVLFFAWAATGLTRYARRRPPLKPIERRASFLGRIETLAVLAPLCLLFLAFVVVQFAYLFGGADTIAATGGLTRAEYARAGFFQLVAVATLVLALLLGIDWAHRPPEQRPGRAVTALSASLIGLTGVMVASALKRMILYVDAFGLTQLRFYTSAFMALVAGLLALYFFTALRGHRRAFATGALLAAGLAVAGLNLANPDAVIAAVNLDRRLAAGIELDTAYLVSSLSEDATPTIVGRLEPAASRCEPWAQSLAGQLRLEGVDPAGGWRSWHWARGRAAAALESLTATLLAEC